MGLGFVRPFSTVILFPKRGLTSNSKSFPGKAALFQGMIAFFRNESWRFHIRRRPDSIHLHAVAPDKIGRLRRSGDGPGEDIQQV